MGAQVVFGVATILLTFSMIILLLLLLYSSVKIVMLSYP
jgi:hypothetical protein